MYEDYQGRFLLSVMFSSFFIVGMGIFLGFNQIQLIVGVAIYYFAMGVVLVKIEWIEKPWENEFVISEEMTIYWNSLGESWVFFKEHRYELSEIVSFIDRQIELHCRR